MLKEGERLDDLQNGLYLIQDPDLFCFGIDAVLLAHFPVIRKNDRVLDMGTGSGVIPLIMSACSETNFIYALEIQDVMASLARRNVEYNGLQERISVIQGDIKEAAAYFENASFSLITCNPPYSGGNAGKANENESVSIARHEILVTLEQIIQSASYLLKNSGRFCMIHRPSRIPEIFELLKKYHLEPKRMRLVQPSWEKPANLVLVEAVKGGKPYMITEPTLVVHREDGSYTDEVLRIYGRRERN